MTRSNKIIYACRECHNSIEEGAPGWENWVCKEHPNSMVRTSRDLGPSLICHCGAVPNDRGEWLCGHHSDPALHPEFVALCYERAAYWAGEYSAAMAKASSIVDERRRVFHLSLAATARRSAERWIKVATELQAQENDKESES